MATATETMLGREQLLARYRSVRAASVAMCAGLEPAEFRLQPCDDVSPPWWNLSHTSWFFARNVLGRWGERTELDDQYDYLLNSYYASLGERLPRKKRGLVTRPTTEEVFEYRESVDERMQRMVENASERDWWAIEAVVRIGVEHEQQHQELFYTEIKCILAQNPSELRRAYHSEFPKASEATRPLAFRFFEGGLHEFGNVEGEWCWDNELPVHKQFVHPFALSNRLVTNAEFAEFVADGGYKNQLLWLDNGWQACYTDRWQSPLYWERHDGQWREWTLSGWQRLQPHLPVCHVSFYEADAFARWRSETHGSEPVVRLPTEREWELAARSVEVAPRDQGFSDDGLLHPTAAPQAFEDLHGVLWQWTASYYEPYPGYRPFPGVLAEYNGKFMDNQRVLRGGSCATPRNHYRLSYRNFWPASTRFQFTGLRLAHDA
jgi:ergothioneine biosynthesis protein EgtB